MRTLTLAGIICMIASLVGCGEKRRTGEPFPENGCKYVYERKVEGEQKETNHRQSDYVVIFFSCNSTGKILLPGPAHNFALFAKVKTDKPEESVTISWFPKSMNVNTRVGEFGVNADVPTTLAWAKANQLTVERFGPYYIREDMYLRAKTQVTRLNAGTIQYRLNDDQLRQNGTALNSVHAISDILLNGDRFDQFLVGTGKGRDASGVLKSYFEKEGYLDGKYRNDKDLLQQFGLETIRRID